MGMIKRGFCSRGSVVLFFASALFCGQVTGQVVEKRTFMSQKPITAFDNTTFCTAYLSDGVMYTMRDIAITELRNIDRIAFNPTGSSLAVLRPKKPIAIFSFRERNKKLFELKDRDLRTYSPLTLAYIGDGVYELVIRTILVKKANCPVNRLHKKASSLVKASAQSGMMEILEPLLTEEEKSVYRRGRNAHSATMAKHATMADYRRATGFEALMGYLYLKEDFSRILELVHAGLEKEEI